MQRPELLLKHLNRSLRDLLGATSILQQDEERLRSTMLPLMRRLLLAEVVGNQWMVAVGGSQGAGKTTLVRTLYDLQGEDARWLEPNEGRGEQLPILIQEDAQCNKPQGVLLEKEVKGEEVNIRDLSGNRSLVRFGAGDEVTVTAGPQGIRFLLISGAPIQEPVAWHGPIVMNTQAEIRQAMADLRNGTFIKPAH